MTNLFEEGPLENAPKYCGVCGKEIERLWYWQGDSGSIYPYIVCYGNKPAWLIWFWRKLSVTSPDGAHYSYKLPRNTVRDKSLKKFDTHTGEKLG